MYWLLIMNSSKGCSKSGFKGTLGGRTEWSKWI